VTDKTSEWTDRQTERQTGSHIDGWTDRRTDTDWWTDRQTDRLSAHF